TVDLILFWLFARLVARVLMFPGSLKLFQRSTEANYRIEIARHYMLCVRQLWHFLRHAGRVAEVTLRGVTLEGLAWAPGTDGTVVTWGDPDYGGGAVVAWGDLRSGGCCAEARRLLTSAQAAEARRRAFAAALEAKADPRNALKSQIYAGDEVGDVLCGVQRIWATDSAFCALRADGSVVTWGHAPHGGDSSQVRKKLRDVRCVTGSSRAFAALKEDGSVLAWGDADHGGDVGHARDELRDVQQIVASAGAFCALRSDGRVVTWGLRFLGGDSSQVQEKSCTAISTLASSLRTQQQHEARLSKEQTQVLRAAEDLERWLPTVQVRLTRLQGAPLVLPLGEWLVAARQEMARFRMSQSELLSRSELCSREGVPERLQQLEQLLCVMEELRNPRTSMLMTAWRFLKAPTVGSLGQLRAGRLRGTKVRGPELLPFGRLLPCMDCLEGLSQEAKSPDQVMANMSALFDQLMFRRRIAMWTPVKSTGADVCGFVSPVALALLVVVATRRLGADEAPLLWKLLLEVLVDVAHVYGTLCRTVLDSEATALNWRLYLLAVPGLLLPTLFVNIAAASGRTF
ncbi:unnamed protein product, partial [Effrenium voratum]